MKDHDQSVVPVTRAINTIRGRVAIATVPAFGWVVPG